VRYVKNTHGRNRVSITLINDDFNDIFSKIYCVKNWKIFFGDKTKLHTNIRLNNKDLCDFFRNYNYENKTYCSFEKVWNDIPIEYRGYFLRGYTDGDGCIYYNYKYNKITTKNISWVAHSKYDYSFLCNFLTSMNIIYHQFHSQTHKRIMISNYSDIMKICDFIYPDFTFGLTRKYKKYQFIKEYYEQKRS